ncbi:MAG: hypothetical protein HW390_3217 [Candidatus Brocadiaceae bacterium]|nr:hypothetical protein [Candidatus Brocadiaceae bacterium]
METIVKTVPRLFRDTVFCILYLRYVTTIKKKVAQVFLICDTALLSCQFCKVELSMKQPNDNRLWHSKSVKLRFTQSNRLDHIEALMNKRLLLDVMGNHKGAIDSYDKALKVKPDFEPLGLTMPVLMPYSQTRTTPWTLCKKPSS